MRIAVVTDLMRDNGAGLMALAQTQLLARTGAHEVTLHSASYASSLAEKFYDHRTFMGTDVVLDKPISPVEYMQVRREFRSWLIAGLKETDPEIVVTHNVGRVLDQVQVAQLSRSVPVGAVIYDQWFTRDSHYTFEHQRSVRHEYEPGRAKGLSHSFGHLATVSQSAGRLVGIAPSCWLRSEWIAVYPTLPCVHLHSPINSSTFRLGVRTEARERLGIAPDALVVGFVGDPNHARKGFARLATAVERMLQQRSDVTVLVVGGLKSSIGANASRVLAPDSILGGVVGSPPAPGVPASIALNTIVIGAVDRSLISDLYATMNVLVHPSAIDNLPAVPTEAGFVGTRCLATNVGGTEETMANQKDLLDPRIGPIALANAISEALTESVNETETERRARRDPLIAEFDLEYHRPQLEAVLQWIAGGVS